MDHKISMKRPAVIKQFSDNVAKPFGAVAFGNLYSMIIHPLNLHSTNGLSLISQDASVTGIGLRPSPRSRQRSRLVV
jgi:hypothetical protein